MANNTASVELQLPTMVSFQFPLKGVDENWARAAQPEGTCPDALNVMPYDLTGRARGGQRPGVSLVSADQYGAPTNTARAQMLMQVTTEVAGVRRENLMLVAGGLAYAGTALGALALLNTSSTASRGTGYPWWTGGGGGSILPPYHLPTTTAPLTISGYPLLSAAAIDGVAYLVDGVSATGYAVDFTVAPPTWTPITVSAGTGPFSTKPTIAAVYRKRLVVAGGTADDPQNFYASRVGVPGDWDYALTDPAAAFAGNASKAGEIGEPITALVPFGDDAMLIGCDRSIWLMNGDVKDGGRIDVISRNCGILGSKAWTFDPNGNLYFAGTTGLFRIARGVYQIESLSADSYNSYFVALTTGTRALTLLWDRDRHGLWIFAAVDPVGASKHLWWDERTKGFFPLAFPDVMGPTAAMTWSPPGGGQTLVLGGRQATTTSGAQLYKLDATVSTDNGTAVNSFAWCGPLRPGSISQESLLEACDFIMGELPAGFTGTFHVDYTLQAGSSADAAYEVPHYSTTGTFTTGGRQTLQRNRLRGESFMLKLSNGSSNASWGIEQATGHFRPGGRVRKLP